MMLSGPCLGSHGLGEASQRNVLALDASGNGYHGVYTGEPTLGVGGALSGDPDPCAYFPTAGECVMIGDQAAFSFASNIFTFEFWYQARYTSNAEGILGKRGDPWEYSIHRAGANLEFTTWNATGTEVYATTYAVPDVDWHYYVWAADGTDARLYVDTVLKTTVGKSGSSMANTTSPLILALGGGI